MTKLAFHIDVTEPAAREVAVRATWTDDGADQVEFFLPTWTPGSYLLREYARHLSNVRAYVPGTDRELDCVKVAKNRWSVAGSDQGIELRYRVYAHELTVRTADVDAQISAATTPTIAGIVVVIVLAVLGGHVRGQRQ